MKKQKTSGHEPDKTLTTARSLSSSKKKKLQTDEPLSEKDEVKQAEEKQHKRTHKKD